MRCASYRALIGAILFLATISVAPGLQAASRGLTVDLRANETKDAPVLESIQLYGSSIALVIGNDAYRGAWPRLSNAVKDARLVADALIEKGFDVTLKTNLNSKDLNQAFEEFFYETGQDPEARLFLWYAGHGYSERGEGFLVPIDAPDPSERGDFLRNAMSLRRMGEYMRGSDARHILSVFDSCFAGTIFNVGRSKAPPAITHATTRLVRQFLTSGEAGQEVSDDGLFRKLFIRAINGDTDADANHDGYVAASELGLFITNEITNYSNGAQTPRNGKLNDPELNQGDFVFQLASATSAPAQTPPVQVQNPTTRPPSDVHEHDLPFWESVKDSNDPALFDAYLQKFPKGSFAQLAWIKRNALLKKPETQEKVRLENQRRARELEMKRVEAVRVKTKSALTKKLEQEHSRRLAEERKQNRGDAKRKIVEKKQKKLASLTPPAQITPVKDGRGIWTGTAWSEKIDEWVYKIKFSNTGDKYTVNLIHPNHSISPCSGRVNKGLTLSLSTCESLLATTQDGRNPRFEIEGIEGNIFQISVSISDDDDGDFENMPTYIVFDALKSKLERE